MLTYIEKEFKAVRYCAILSFHRLAPITIFATINVIYSQGIHYIKNHDGGGGGGEPYESSTTSTSAYCFYLYLVRMFKCSYPSLFVY